MTSQEIEECYGEIERLKQKLKKKNKQLKKLKMSNLFLESLFEGISEEIMVLDNDYNVIDVNKAFLERHDLFKKNVIGRKCFNIKRRGISPCFQEMALCPVENARTSGDMVETAYSAKDENGDVREFVFMIYPLKPQGEDVEYFLEIARDVTEYRQMVFKLQRSEKRFRAILDTATDAIISVDDNHNIILFNNAALKIFGYRPEEVIGKDLTKLIPNEYENHREYIDRFLLTKESKIIGKTISLIAVRKNGEKFPIELSLSALEMGRNITFTAIIRDVTEQRQIKDRLLQSERLAAVGTAVAHVAHEIKNPLMIIGGLSNQIKMNLDKAKDLNKIDIITDEVQRLERLAANLGDFTKKYRLVRRPSDINSVIRDVIQIMTGTCSKERYTFRETLSTRVKTINCDPDKLKQVFINIIYNGLEAMQDGGEISVSTDKIENGIEIRINDHGTGIPEEDLKHIFEPFYTTRERGSGLGLSISYKLIEAHEGDIWAVSSPGKGTTFIIRLPV